MSLLVTYADWIDALEQFGKGDDSILDKMNASKFSIDSGTAQRFYIRVEDSFKQRKQDWLEKFQRSFQIHNIKTDDDFEMALRNGKQNLSPLMKFSTSNGLPDDLKNTLQKDLREFVDEIKKSLKDTILKTSSGREKMLIMLNSFGLPELILSRSQSDNSTQTNFESNNKRNIIF